MRRRSSGALRRVTAHAESCGLPGPAAWSISRPCAPVIASTQSWPWLLAWVLKGGAIMAHVVFWLVALIAAVLMGPMGFTVVIAAWIGFKRPLRTLARQFVEHAPFAS